MTKTNGKTMLPKGLAFNNSKSTLGLLDQVERNLYRSKATKTSIIPIIIYQIFSNNNFLPEVSLPSPNSCHSFCFTFSNSVKCVI